MKKIRVTKEFDFEMAHALLNYDGACSNIHGHSYRLFVTIMGGVNDTPGDPKKGMVVDFGDVKRLIKSEIVSKFDHALIVNEESDIKSVTLSKELFQRMKTVPFQPTCENLLLYMVEIIKEKLPDGLKLFSLKLRETSTSYAEWYASDNQ